PAITPPLVRRARTYVRDARWRRLYPSSEFLSEFYARVVKLVDTRHLKCLAGETGMPVRVRPWAPEGHSVSDNLQQSEPLFPRNSPCRTPIMLHFSTVAT